MASPLASAPPRTALSPPSQAALLAGPPFAALAAALGRPVAAVTSTPLSGGMANRLSALRVTYEDGSEESFALKTNSLGRATGTDTEGNEDTSAAAAFGMAREALFYLHLAPGVRAALPPGSLAGCAFAAGDMASGRKTLLLELLTGGIDSGLAYGGGSPLNWARGAAVAAAAAVATPEGAAASAFRLAARLHGAFWCERTLLAHDWLAGAKWRRRAGEFPSGDGGGGDSGEAAWHASQAHALKGWAAERSRSRALSESDAPPSADAPVVWDAEFPAVAAAMDGSVAKSDWASYRRWAQASPFSLCQADFHPGNALLFPAADEESDNAGNDSSSGTAEGARRWPRGLPRTALVDWEAVSAGSPGQDLGQYVISHMEPSVRRGCEGRLLRAYHAELCDAITAKRAAEAAASPSADAAAAALPTYDDVYAEYVAGGLARWAWLLGLLVGMCPPPSLRFWGAQMAAFMADHGVAPGDVGMPRP